MPDNKAEGSVSRARDLGMMEGKGYYNKHSKPQHSAIAYGLPLLNRAVESVPLPASGEVFLIADYGVAGGHNSMEPVSRAIDLIRHRTSQDLPVSVVHTDLSTNDFDSLFTLLSSPVSYLVGVSNVFAYAEGASFYERLFPEEQVHVGWNAIAVHWLSSVPATIADHIWSNRATGSAKEAFARQSREDWRDFLEHRGHELKDGGRLVVLGGASDEHGNSDAEGLMDMANEAVQELVATGALRHDEYERMVIPTYNRTLEEFKAPFSKGLADRVLALEHASEVALDDPFWNEFQRSGDAGAFAVACTDFFRAAFGTSIFGALDPDRTSKEHTEIAEAFYEMLRQKVAADPLTAVCNWRVVLLLVAKKSDS